MVSAGVFYILLYYFQAPPYLMNLYKSYKDRTLYPDHFGNMQPIEYIKELEAHKFVYFKRLEYPRSSKKYYYEVHINFKGLFGGYLVSHKEDM